MSNLVSRRSCDRVSGTRFQLTGWIADYVDAISDQWLTVVPSSNPAILDMFADRDREPKRELLPWSGEFAGKYLTSAVQVLRLTDDPRLRAVIADFVARLVSLQAEDGYLGPYPTPYRLSGKARNIDLHIPGHAVSGEDAYTWDAWGHYHAMLGLLLWYEDTSDRSALACARRIGDLLCDVFGNASVADQAAHLACAEMNQAPIHSLGLLYRHTGDERYLELARKFRDEFGAVDAEGRPVAGDYLDGPLSGQEFHELPRPRWESLHPIMGLSELAAITGDDDSREAFERIWWSIVSGDRHNNGGFSSGEQAVGNPYDPTAIETCCTIAWIAMSVEMLRLTGDSIVADELELSTLNSSVGMHSRSGRWVTYNTPMDGVRKAATDDIHFQAREGSPDLSCCTANGPRALGTISDWAVTAAEGEVFLNWYGPGSITVPLDDGTVALEQETEYPREGAVSLTVNVDRPRAFVLSLRIPHWSRTTRVRVAGEELTGVEPGRYLRLDRTWTPGDRIEIEFDFSLQYWVGERECEGRTSIYRGPILLTYDRRLNPFDPDDIPELDARGLRGELVASDDWMPPLLLLELPGVDGRAVRLCDFASAGSGGSPYRSWLAVRSCAPTAFSRAEPRRSAPVREDAPVG